MSNPTPYRINEDQSDMRVVKEGWYAMDEKGKLTLGPFSGRYSQSARTTVFAILGPRRGGRAGHVTRIL
jgi:hypothetical protein